jgi:hypothetical protein
MTTRKNKRSRKLLLFGILALIIFIPTAIYLARNPFRVSADSLFGFNEGSGTTVNDASGNTGTITDAIWKLASDCLFGSCLYFNGSSSYVSFGDNEAYDFEAATNYTISFWFKTPAISSGTRVFVSKYVGDDAEGGYKVYMNSSGQVCFGVDDDNSWGPDDSACSQNRYDDSIWHHLSAVKTGTSNLVLYINALPVASDDSISATGTLENNDPFVVGMDADLTSNPYTGYIDELKIYTATAHTEDQVKADAIPGSGLFGTSASFGDRSLGEGSLPDGLIGYWDMNEATWSGTLNEVVDSSGNDNHGTVMGAVGGKPYPTAGKYGSGGFFDGTDDFITTPDSASLSPTSGLTISGWVKMGSQGFSGNSDYNQGMVDKGDYQFYLDKSDGKARWVVNDAAAKAFSNLDGGLGNTVYALAVHNGSLYAGGQFTSVGSGGTACTGCNNVARWTGSAWTNLDQGLNLTVWALGVYNGSLYAGGQFTAVGSGGTACTGCNRVARWTGSAWTNLDAGLNYQVESFAVYNGSLYAGGYFTDVGSGGTACTGCNGVARWTGSAWTNLDAGLGSLEGVKSLVVYNGSLYAAGEFLAVGSGGTACTGCNYVARWTGSAWTNLDKGFNNIVNSLAVYDGSLYAAGGFNLVGSGGTACTGCNGVARWTGSAWTNVDQGTDHQHHSVDTLVVHNGSLYAAGNFSEACTGCNYIARWTGSAWTNLDQGVNNQIWSLAVHNGTLYAAGSFTAADPGGTACTGCNRVAKWGTTANNAVATTTSSWTANTWYHFAATYDSSSMSLYVNGNLENTVTSTPTTITATSLPLLMGKTYGSQMEGKRGGSGEQLSGSLDDIKIYNYARTPTQIVEDMNEGFPDPGSPIGSATSYWDFNEGSGTTAHDASINANNLTLNSASWTTSGKYDKAWNGTGATWLTRADDSDFDFSATDDFTVSTWFKSDSATNPSATEYLINKASATVAGYAVYVNTSGQICFALDDDTTWTPDVVSCTTEDYHDGTWHHLVAVRNTVSDKIYLYLDGQLKDHDPDTTTATLANSLALFIGDRDGVDNGDEYNGDLDELKIYRQAFTADHVKAEFNQGKAQVMGALSTAADGKTSDNSAARAYCVPGDTNSCSPSVGHWKLDEGNWSTNCSTQDVYDTSGNSYNGKACPSASAPVVANGRFGNAALLDGVNDYIDVSGVSSAIATGSYTVSFWFSPTTTFNSGSSGDQHLFALADAASYNDIKFTLIGGDGRIKLWGYNASEEEHSTYSTTTAWTAGTWYHISGSFDLTNGLQLYVNGTKQSQNASANTRGATQSAVTMIGSEQGTSLFLDGKVDDLRIYNYNRTPAQIAWDYNRGAPIAQYDFNECTGTALHNTAPTADIRATPPYPATLTLSGNNAGTCDSLTATDSWYLGRTGKYSGALGLDGNDSVAITDHANLRFDAASQDFSLFTWVKRAAAGAVHTLMSKEDADNDGYRLIINADNTVTCSVDSIDITSTTTIDTAWHHVGCVIKRSGTGQIYIDGVPSGAPTAINAEAMATTANLTLGARSYTATNYLNGLLDDLRLYNYALTAEQIKTLYNYNSAVQF